MLRNLNLKIWHLKLNVKMRIYLFFLRLIYGIVLYLEVKEELALARGDMEEAERIAAEDKLTIEEVDVERPDDNEDDTASSKPKKQKKDAEDLFLSEIRKKFADAQAELKSVRNTLSVTEPATERTTFIDWVREVCKNISDDQFTEFQKTFIQMQARWKKQHRSDQRPISPPFSTKQPAARGCSGFQPMPSQWGTPPPHLQDATPWQSQDPEYMQTYMHQSYLNPGANTEDTSQAVSSALLDLNNPYTA